MSIVRVKSHDLNKLNESLQRISLFEDNLKKSDIMKDPEDDTFYTDIDTDNAEVVASNLNDDDDITMLDDSDSPETKRQKLITAFTNALSSEMEINDRLQKIIDQYQSLDEKDDNASDHEWKMDNKKHDIYLKDTDAHIFRQNRNICLSYNQKVHTFQNVQELNEYLAKHNIQQVDENLMNSLVESTESDQEVLTEAPLWTYGAKAADKIRDWGNNIKQSWQDRGKEGITPEEIWDAVVNNHISFIKGCVKHGVDMNVHTDTMHDESGKIVDDCATKTPLMYAAEKGKTDMVKAIAEDKNTINVADNDGWTPLMYSILPENSAEIVPILLDKGADLEAEDVEGRTALSMAQETNKGDVVKIIEDHMNGASAEQQMSADELVDIIKTQDSAQLEQALQRPDIAKTINSPMDSKSQTTPLMYAAAHAKAYDVQKMIDAGGDINIKDRNFRTAVMYAANSKDSDPETISVLENAGANLDTRDKSGLSARDYLAKTRPEMAQANTNQANNAKAAKSKKAANTTAEPEEDEGEYVDADEVFDGEGDYEVDDGASETETLKALNKSRLDVTKTLVNQGNANVNAVDPETGEAPLDQADNAGDKEMSDFLKSKGAQNAVKPEEPEAEEDEFEDEETQANESFSDYISSLKNKVSLSEDDDEPSLDECMGGVGAGVTTASFAPAVTHTMYKRPSKKKKK